MKMLPAAVSIDGLCVVTRLRFGETLTEKLVRLNHLTYAPSALARSLQVKQTRTIGSLNYASTNPFIQSWCGVERKLLF